MNTKNHEFSKSPNNNVFLKVYRSVILVFLNAVSIVLIVYMSKNSFDWQLFLITFLFLIALFYCFINYFLKPFINLESKKKKTLVEIIRTGFAIKEFSWKKQIICIRNNTVVIISKTKLEYRKIENFCSENNLVLLEFDNFKEIFNFDSIAKTNEKNENSILTILEFLNL